LEGVVFVASIPFNLNEVDILLKLVCDFREDIEEGNIKSTELQSLTVATYDVISKLKSIESSVFNCDDFEFLDIIIGLRRHEIMEFPKKKRTAEMRNMLKTLLALDKKLKMTMDIYNRLPSFDDVLY
jgi:hypothetical protein